MEMIDREHSSVAANLRTLGQKYRRSSLPGPNLDRITPNALSGRQCEQHRPCFRGHHPWNKIEGQRKLIERGDATINAVSSQAAAESHATQALNK